MRGSNYLIALMGVIYSAAAFSQSPTLPATDVQSIDALAEKVYKIPYRDVVCAFGRLNPKTHAYADKKFSDNKVREKAYQATFGDVFSSALLSKFDKQCVDTEWAGLKPDFRTADQDSDDDYLNSHAPVLKVKGKPVIIQRNGAQARVKVLWKQVYTEGGNTQVTNGRTDLILVREHGLWRVDDAIANPSSAYDAAGVGEFDKSIGVSRLRG
ncbi:hypothetical protein [Burkholderia ubonensis]|uniref:DUF3828 domain-containing protein n=1 Tax=Burkholderia ubonensis TaxID=101571 RepID=A0AB74DAQ5_9BURK|nr:hypothetical protein [Burkholderia ubonensis]PAJ76436.1 hypothetical protein CJO71_33390 [Burkholderia ubonensis]PAJ84246.1 hypothetical protein CJO70_30035 [Burkholderia ubonensis]PAJ91658.1 hypothetical protein CJO69_27300 [Burkholderia ubonensis]PAJ98050.1 hypothetical protein CJO68_28335 [Burkholderia ubonensis]PAK04753.1 hypothetical protein CJO67_26240 [Burkholderia ubonensis]